jgi:predicted transcriptional regulator
MKKIQKFSHKGKIWDMPINTLEDEKEIYSNFKKLGNVFISLIKILNDGKKRKVLDLCYKKPLSISEISRNLKMSYRSTWFCVEVLSKYCLIHRRKYSEEKHQPVYIYSLITSKNLMESILKEHFGHGASSEDLVIAKTKCHNLRRI